MPAAGALFDPDHVAPMRQDDTAADEKYGDGQDGREAFGLYA